MCLCTCTCTYVCALAAARTHAPPSALRQKAAVLCASFAAPPLQAMCLECVHQQWEQAAEAAGAGLARPQPPRTAGSRPRDHQTDLLARYRGHQQRLVDFLPQEGLAGSAAERGLQLRQTARFASPASLRPRYSAIVKMPGSQDGQHMHRGRSEP